MFWEQQSFYVRAENSPAMGRRACTNITVLYFGKTGKPAGQVISRLPGSFYRVGGTGSHVPVKSFAPAFQALRLFFGFNGGDPKKRDKFFYFYLPFVQIGHSVKSPNTIFIAN